MNTAYSVVTVSIAVAVVGLNTPCDGVAALGNGVDLDGGGHSEGARQDTQASAGLDSVEEFVKAGLSDWSGLSAILKDGKPAVRWCLHYVQSELGSTNRESGTSAAQASIVRALLVVDCLRTSSSEDIKRLCDTTRVLGDRYQSLGVWVVGSVARYIDKADVAVLKEIENWVTAMEAKANKLNLQQGLARARYRLAAPTLMSESEANKAIESATLYARECALEDIVWRRRNVEPVWLDAIVQQGLGSIRLPERSENAFIKTAGGSRQGVSDPRDGSAVLLAALAWSGRTRIIEGLGIASAILEIEVPRCYPLLCMRVVPYTFSGYSGIEAANYGFWRLGRSMSESEGVLRALSRVCNEADKRNEEQYYLLKWMVQQHRGMLDKIEREEEEGRAALHAWELLQFARG